MGPPLWASLLVHLLNLRTQVYLWEGPLGAMMQHHLLLVAFPGVQDLTEGPAGERLRIVFPYGPAVETF